MNEMWDVAVGGVEPQNFRDKADDQLVGQRAVEGRLWKFRHQGTIPTARMTPLDSYI